MTEESISCYIVDTIKPRSKTKVVIQLNIHSIDIAIDCIRDSLIVYKLNYPPDSLGSYFRINIIIYNKNNKYNYNHHNFPTFLN